MNGLAAHAVCKSFGGLQVAQNINLSLPPRARKALIGPNGAGKTTFANLLTGVLAPTSGTITFDNEDISNKSEAARVKLGIAKTFQVTKLFNRMTVRENIVLPILERDGKAGRWFGRPLADTVLQDEVETLLDMFRIEHLADREVRTLAYGQQRLIEMILALALRPRLLILDEPAAGVPETEVHLVIDAIERLPKDLAVLIIEHDMNVVFRVAHQIVVLVNGSILVEGTPREIADDRLVQKLYLGASHV